MHLKKSILSLAFTTALSTGVTQASILLPPPNLVNMNFEGLFTVLSSEGTSLQNTSLPYYYDPTWGYGHRTQISGTLQFNADTGYGTATVNPFEFFNKGAAVISDFQLQTIDDDLILGNMIFSYGGSDTISQIVLDASGLFSELRNGASIGDTFDGSTCASSSSCATPASNNISKFRYPIGPVPIATSSFNTTGQTGLSTTFGQLSLGTDDGIGGSPMDNGGFSGANFNFDITSVTIVSTVPVPAAVWLFGSGLLTLVGLSRQRKTHN